MEGTAAVRQRTLAQNLAIASGVAVGLGLGPTILRGVGRDEGLDAVGGAIVLALASVVAGALAGFLFGVPRSRPEIEGGPAGRGRFGGNTNLEQISDWLTKILVGVGLTQLGAIRAGAARLFDSVAPILGDRPDDPAFAGTLIVYFVVVGFVSAWLGTRLYLGAALDDADRALELLDQAVQAEAEGNDDRAAALRKEAAAALATASPHARRYEDLRSQLRSGPDRTRALESVVSAALANLATTPVTTADVRTLFDTGQDGDRVVALAQMAQDASLVDIDRAMAPLRSSRSAFELYYALEAIARYVTERDVDADLAARIITGLDHAVSEQRIRPGSDRDSVAQRIRARLPTGAEAADEQ